MEPIQSRRNPAVVEAGRLHRVRERRRTGLTLVEGPHIVAEALAAGVTVRHTFVLPDDPAAEVWPRPRLVDHAVMKALAGTETPRGPVAVIEIPPPAAPPTDQHLIVLWGVGDPGNIGTIIRTAAAFGLGVAIGPGTADPWSPKVVRAAAGGHFRLSLTSIDAVGDLSGWRVAATATAGGVAPSELEDGRWAVLVGSEPHGLDDSIVATAEKTVTIPMPGGSESLNVAAAAAIIAYELGGAAG